MYYFVLAVFIACYLLVQRIVSSPYGQVLKAIKQNEPVLYRLAITWIVTRCWHS